MLYLNQFESMTDEELVTLQDELADNTGSLGTGHVREEYRFRKIFRVARAMEEQSQTMGKHTKAIHWYTVIILVATVVNLAIGVWGVIG